MNKTILTILFVSSFFIVSCKKQDQQLLPNVDVESLQSEFLPWWIYINKQIFLSSDFIGYDKSGIKISKREFLSQLKKGGFIPIKLISEDDREHYRLYPLDKNADKSIDITMKSSAASTYEYFLLEGTPFPQFNFTDLNGINYTSENTKGKIIVIKCWFINCNACVAEFPELNELVHEYEKSNDVLFLSIAQDNNEKLQAFLQRKPLKYANIGQQKIYMKDTLIVKDYPTHYVIDKKGIIQKVVSRANEMIFALKKMQP